MCIRDRAESVVEVDMERSEQVRRWWPFLRDRRIDAYGDITKLILEARKPYVEAAYRDSVVRAFKVETLKRRALDLSLIHI